MSLSSSCMLPLLLIIHQLGVSATFNCNGGKQNDKIHSLPGWSYSFFPTMYSGFVQVNQSSNASLFYWFIESLATTNRSKQDIPILIWLNGGPGASSLTGLFAENGLFRINDDLTLNYNNYTWLQDYHMLFVDNPIGTGFSFCDNGTWVTTNEQMAANFLTFINVWYSQCHPEFKTNPLYVTGESHAGKYIPFISTYIINYNKNSPTSINLKGLIVGNGYNNPEIMYKSAPSYAFNLGIIDEYELDIIQKEIDSCFAMIPIDPSYATDICVETIKRMYKDYAGNIFVYNVYHLSGDFWAQIMQNLAIYLNQTSVKNAIHVGDTKWKSGDGTEAPNPVATALKPDMMIDNSWQLYTSLLKHVRILFYNGQLDGSVCNNFGSQLSLRQLRYNGDWDTLPRKPWFVMNDNEQSLAGYVKQSVDQQLTYFVVSDSGHLCPFDQPFNIQQIVTNWIELGSWN